MKVRIQEQENIKQVEVVILCKEQSTFDNILAKKIEHIAIFISGTNEEKTEQIPIDEIYYFESVENCTYIYCKEKVYSSNMKLYELEEELKDTTFQRISKSSILNLDKMKSVKGQINGRMSVVLDNDEKLIVNRSYVSRIRECMQLLF